MVDIAVVVGNPKPNSRTLAAARHVAAAVGGGDVTYELDLISLGGKLIGWGESEVAVAVERVRTADVVVFASPTYKASFTGLLKLFLDQFGAGSLAGTVAIPLMLGGSPAHSLAAELHLKPVLAELGAWQPTPALYLIDSEWQQSATLTAWLPGARTAVSRLVSDAAE